MGRKKIIIPPRIQIGGQTIIVKNVQNFDDRTTNVISSMPGGYIIIADECRDQPVTDEAKLKAFLHGCTSIILCNMGRHELMEDQFVSSFAGFVQEILKSVLK